MYIQSSIYNTQLNTCFAGIASLHTTRLENDPLQFSSSCQKERVLASTSRDMSSLVMWSQFTDHWQPLESHA